ncbi:energy transducer TonB [Dyella jiangningensis]|uniref:energy transducer TonB n=1 Tax=Dyella jiangningensis TaxID=1379159 RepID=UPI001559CB4F|nr:energy transducer TonB [Dyella jiangningensis]
MRTTTSLSVLALLVGIAGTAWLSTFTDEWKGPAPSMASHADKVRTVLRRHARPARMQVAVPLREPATATAAGVPRAEAAPALPSLTPIDMPSLPGSWLGRTASGQGRVVLRLSVDGEGRAQSASVAQSSGDAALDDRAVRMALGWRFAVPADHPGGLTGQLVMRFDE